MFVREVHEGTTDVFRSGSKTGLFIAYLYSVVVEIEVLDGCCVFQGFVLTVACLPVKWCIEITSKIVYTDWIRKRMGPWIPKDRHWH